ncbi:DNA-3-methyladenine glycosylase [Aeromicrobium sp. REDSEA-S32_B7]|uniref:DNA-3-methyladenine glycosylase n=1 Tax=Aeromicrobium sp. REDSEA-S32_B7 TaxID=1811526 RepID=UPI000A4DDB09|nr:DNA-3-methyladenine glycosylase [Aeromicrobium sp. REDSEA-S32_B7]
MTSDDDVAARAVALLGRELRGHGVTVRITEVEAYGGILDPASHAYTRTPRSEIMYGPPWRLYVYRSYGIHWCANVVTGPTEQAAAVLVRAGRVVDGLDLARERRGDVADTRLARGPGNLAQALGAAGVGVLDLLVRCRRGSPLAGALPQGVLTCWCAAEGGLGLLVRCLGSRWGWSPQGPRPGGWRRSWSEVSGCGFVLGVDARICVRASEVQGFCVCCGIPSRTQKRSTSRA